MKHSWLGCLLVGGLLFAGTQDSDLNVNKRYTVDTVTVAGKGWKTNVADQQTDKFSSGLRKDLVALIGQKLNPGTLDGLAARLKKELSASEVSHHVLRGETPDHVRVEFEVKPPHYGVDATVTKFLYDSKQGWSGAGSVGFTVQQNSFGFGLASDGDTLNERFAGISARYENKHLGSDRVGLKFEFESYHEQWNQGTLNALALQPNQTSDAYRTRQNFQPTATISLAKPLTLEIGVGFERFQNQFPAVHTEAANAVITTLRYHQRLADSEYQQDLDADYTLRAATKLLDTDFVYTSHVVGLHYRVAHGKHQLMEQVVAGSIGGQAPLADRFVAGNSYYLRGWNKYDIDPIGGNRLVHNTVEYRYGAFQAFYDAGAVWESGQAATPRHSLGVGFKESIFSLAVAFPVKSGHVEPIVMLGMIY
jgi:outer membrane protein assembly factor BamA